MLAHRVLGDKVTAGLAAARKVLTQNRNPQLASEVHHEYADKFYLAEFLTTGACASGLAGLGRLGLDSDKLKQVKEWSKERSVTLRLESDHTCTFDKKTEREVENPTKSVTEVSGFRGSGKITHKTVTKVTEYFWDFKAVFELSAYMGSDPAQKVVLMAGDGATRIKTTTEAQPQPKKASNPPIEVNITWLLQALNDACQVHFTIDRTKEACWTPRRNPDIDQACDFFGSFRGWCGSVGRYFSGTLFPIQQNHGLDLTAMSSSAVLVPILPLLEALDGEGSVEPVQGKGQVVLRRAAQSKTLPLADLEAFLGEEERALDERFAVLDKVYPSSGLVTRHGARVVVVLDHAEHVCAVFHETLGFLEQMLREQLVAAIGKEVTSSDFTQYMRFHNRKLFKEGYWPEPFCYAVRRPQHNPEGVVGIEQLGIGDSKLPEPVATVVRTVEEDATQPMRFQLSASATVTFTGRKHLHAYVGHRFSTEPMAKLQLAARARQFSGFVMLIGHIGGADLFLPKHAMLVQNKDAFTIPLLLEEIPTPKEFKDAIESLSPEQQRFAKAYRGMQLEATLFGVCVVQVKPQLERVLNLPPDSLTKEIELTQDLLELFIEYQIPSDLLSYQCDDVCADVDDVSAKTRVDAVKGHVAAMKEMLKRSKEKELEEEEQVKRMRKLEAEVHIPEAYIEEECDDLMAMPLMDIQCGAPRAMAMECGAMNMLSACVDLPESCAAPAPPAPSAPSPANNTQQPSSGAKPDTPQPVPEKGEGSTVGPSKMGDISKLPDILEKRYEAHDTDNCLRPTIIKTGDTWEKTFQRKLLTKPETKLVDTDDQKKEKEKAFDLLDALTRSGVLAIEDASLHVVVASTHCFDRTLMDTVIQRNVNPVEKVERSTLITASAIHDTPAPQLLNADHVQRVASFCPSLFIE